jgi:hypothetical protein
VRRGERSRRALGAVLTTVHEPAVGKILMGHEIGCVLVLVSAAHPTEKVTQLRLRARRGSHVRALGTPSAHGHAASQRQASLKAPRRAKLLTWLQMRSALAGARAGAARWAAEEATHVARPKDAIGA